MTYWNTKIALTALGIAGSAFGCHYCTALLATIACATVAEQIGELRARRYSRQSAVIGLCGSHL